MILPSFCNQLIAFSIRFNLIILSISFPNTVSWFLYPTPRDAHPEEFKIGPSFITPFDSESYSESIKASGSPCHIYIYNYGIFSLQVTVFEIFDRASLLWKTIIWKKSDPIFKIPSKKLWNNILNWFETFEWDEPIFWILSYITVSFGREDLNFSNFAARIAGSNFE